MKRSIALSLFVLTLAVAVMAQSTPQQITYSTPQQTTYSTPRPTTYSNSYFSATFEGPVKDDIERNPSGKSTNHTYEFCCTNVDQEVIVRTLDSDIPVNFSSSNFYANDDNTGGITSTTTGNYQGHPFTYSLRRFTRDGKEISKRERFIIVNPRVVMFISQAALWNYDDSNEWSNFVTSLDIKASSETASK
jgi:hypothetical protein